jgi:hypothetical protein
MDLKLVFGGFAVFIAGAVLYAMKAVTTESPLMFRLAFIGLIILGVIVVVLGLQGERGEASFSEEPVEADEPEEPTPELEEPKIEEADKPEPAKPVPVELKPEVKRVKQDKAQIRETEQIIREVAQSMKKGTKKK